METLAFEGTIEQEKSFKAVFKNMKMCREDLCLYFQGRTRYLWLSSDRGSTNDCGRT